jgi:hypothetical protein
MPDKLQCLAQGLSAADITAVGVPEVEQPVIATKKENSKKFFIAA